MSDATEELPDDLASALALLAQERARRVAAEAEAATAKAEAASARALVSHSEALIARLKLEIDKVRRELYGTRSERKARLLEQMELQLEELEADAGEDELAAEIAAKASAVKAFERKRPSRKPFSEHLPRERVLIAAPTNCACCGSAKLSKLGEDITETLEVVPRQWKVIQTVREKFTCRECEKITQPPAPFHVTPRGFAGPNLLAMILFEKFAQHQPLNRQSERYASEGVDLSLSTLADQVGACAAALKPLHSLIEAHVIAAERLHGDDTTVPILAKGKTDTGRIRIDALFDIEREINGLAADQRLERRRKESMPLVDDLKAWLQTERVKLSRSSPVAEVIDYMLKRWDGFTSFLDDGRICLTNNAAERALRGFAIGRKSWLFAGSDRGADRAAFMATLIMTAKLNEIDPQLWLADVLARIADTPITRLEQLLPWNWTPSIIDAQAA